QAVRVTTALSATGGSAGLAFVAGALAAAEEEVVPPAATVAIRKGVLDRVFGSGSEFVAEAADESWLGHAAGSGAVRTRLAGRRRVRPPVLVNDPRLAELLTEPVQRRGAGGFLDRGAAVVELELLELDDVLRAEELSR